MISLSISHVLKQAQSHHPEIPALEIRLLLQHLLNVDRAWMIGHQNDALGASTHAEFQALLERRVSGEPLPYILGYREFYGLKLKVTPDTLTPRPDTETLVDATLGNLSSPQAKSTLRDLGTGSGAVALAIAKHRPQTLVTALDISSNALKVAETNAQILSISNVSFLRSDWFSALDGMLFDVIVGNPPYIEENDPHLNLGSLPYEPITALASGEDGLDDLRVIIEQAMRYLRPNGWLLLEHGYNQANSVARLMHAAGYKAIGHRYDLAGIARVTMGCRD